MVEEADIKLDGLTVIAGENDTGKSTVGKALFCLLKADLMYWTSKNTNSSLVYNLNNLFQLVFDGQISTNGSIKINDSYDLSINNHQAIINKWPNISAPRSYIESTVIETPLIWSLYNFFQLVSNEIIDKSMFGQFRAEGPIYPYLLWDVYMKLSNPKSYASIPTKNLLIEKISEIIEGSFQRLDNHKYSFIKNGNPISLMNVATGIKHFGILQVLLANNYIQNNKIIFFDEPEVHLHPKWQLKYAEIIIELVKAGVNVVVSSHSPYMVEALQRYSEIEKITDKTNFYFAENGLVQKIEDSNSKTLARTFEKLSEPFDIFEELESEKFQNG